MGQPLAATLVVLGVLVALAGGALLAGASAGGVLVGLGVVTAAFGLLVVPVDRNPS
jgi:hypothetical protein